MTLTLAQSTTLCRLLADASRLRLLVLLEAHELSVAELTEVTGLSQSRVSTHLARLRRAGLIQDRRAGASTLYSAADLSRSGPGQAGGEVWGLLREQLSDAQTQLDRERAEEVVRARRRAKSWAESVAGSMERHYSPGRTWEATARALVGLIEPGDALDIASGDGVLAELLAGRAKSVTCVDLSAAVIAAARKRLAGYANVSFHQADMHALPLESGRYDHVFLMHALSFTRRPKQVLAEAARVLRPGGRLIVATLNAHRHEAAMRAYDHLNLGLRPAALQRLLTDAGLDVESCRVTSRETRPPYFEVITAFARRP